MGMLGCCWSNPNNSPPHRSTSNEGFYDHTAEANGFMGNGAANGSIGNGGANGSIGNREMQLQSFRYNQLADATKSFSHKYLVGEGSFGEVYMAEISPFQGFFAIKKLKRKQNEQREIDFQKEINIIRSVSHPNIVKLIGYCSEEGNRLIVCEYLSNNSLKCHLHGENNLPTLEWSRRMNIAIGSAKGLECFHAHQPKIIHRDVKPDNILLDDNFESKVADFGLAKLFPESNSVTHISSLMRGTRAYADPEHSPAQKVSEKSDVYSFGVVLLELVSGRKPSENFSLVNWAKNFLIRALHNGDYTGIVDPRLPGSYDAGEVQRIVCCAAASVYKPSQSRPTMEQIVEILEGRRSPTDIWGENDRRYLQSTISVTCSS